MAAELLNALLEIGGDPDREDMPNCQGGCGRWVSDCDNVLAHPEHNQAHGVFRCHGAVARDAVRRHRSSCKRCLGTRKLFEGSKQPCPICSATAAAAPPKEGAGK